MSADASHCNEDTAAAIMEAGAGYCLALKEHHPGLYAAATASTGPMRSVMAMLSNGRPVSAPSIV